MTADQMVLECRLLSDNLDSSTVPNISNEGWLYYLNEYQIRFVKTHYTGNNQFQASFQQIQKRTDDLNNLVKQAFAITSTAVSQLSSSYTTYRADLATLYTTEALNTASTNPYMFYVRGNVKVTKGTQSRYVGINVRSLDELDVILLNPHTKPKINNIIGYFQDGDLYVLGDSTFTIDNASITYIKYPRRINNEPALGALTDSELSEQAQKEIIAGAVMMAIGDLEPEKAQIKANQNTTVE